MNNVVKFEPAQNRNSAPEPTAPITDDRMMTAKDRDEAWVIMDRNLKIAASCSWWAWKAFERGDTDEAWKLVRKIWRIHHIALKIVKEVPCAATRSFYRYTYNAHKQAQKIYYQLKKAETANGG